MPKTVDLMLDSGAFSAWKKGTPIELQQYIDFIKANEAYLTVYVNLDDITSPEKTWENQHEMERQGLHPLPVYHVGEPMKYLDMCMEYDYFGVGGMALQSQNTRLREFDMIFAKICPASNKFYPTHKLHGFGMTSLDLMLRYPWYSVDSTSWVLTSRFGSIYVPRIRNGKFIYNANSWKVTVSNRSPANIEEGKHFTTFSPMERKIILDYIEQQGFKLGKSELRKVGKDYKLADGERWFGKDEADAQRSIYGDRTGFVAHGWAKDRIVERIIEPGLVNDYRQRDMLNILYFLNLEKSMPKWPWPYHAKRVGGFFS